MISGKSGLSKFMSRQFNNALQETRSATHNLSTGKRVNRAADDIGAFYMSENLNIEESSKRVVIRNIENSLNMYATAEGAMDVTTKILSRLKELSVQASTETITDSNRELIQIEFEKMISALDHVANATEFNSIPILTQNKVDLGLLVDTSGSMGGLINAVRNSIESVADRLRNEYINLKLGLAEMGTDNYDNVSKTADFTDSQEDFDIAVDNLLQMNAGVLTDPWASLMNVSSPDYDETAPIEQLGSFPTDPQQSEPDAFSWRSDANGKILIVIQDTGREDPMPAGDPALPSNWTSWSGFSDYPGASDNGLTEQTVINTMRAENIEVHTIGSSIGPYTNPPSRWDSQLAMENISDSTGGDYYYTDNSGNQVSAALNSIADDLISRYPGGRDLQLQVGNDASDDSQFSSTLATNVTSSGLGLGLTSVDSIGNAQQALTDLDDALQKFSDIRTEVSAEYNRLLNMLSNEQRQTEQSVVSQSVLRDADIAEESSKLAKAQLKNEIGLSSMSQFRKSRMQTITNLLAT